MHAHPRSLLLIIIAGSALASLPACTQQQTKQERLIEITEHIESPLRTLEARAELELLNPMDPASDDVLRTIAPDALNELLPGSPGYQRALTEPAEVAADALALADVQGQADHGEAIHDKIDPSRKSQAVKLYTQARTLRQTGNTAQAIELLKQASQLDPFAGSLFRELGDALILANDRVGAINAYEHAVELGDRSPRALIHLASDASTRGDDARVLWLGSTALADHAIEKHPMARSIIGVLLGSAQINSGYLKAGALTLEESLSSFDTTSRDLRWKREIIGIMSQRSSLWILAGDAWASIGAHQRAQDAYAYADANSQRSPLALVARQIGSALRQGHPAGASLIFLSHLEHNGTDLGTEEHHWANTLASFKGISDVLANSINELSTRPNLQPSVQRSLLGVELEALDTEQGIIRLANAGSTANDPILCLQVLRQIEDEDERFDAASSILEANPTIARAVASGFLRTLDHPVKFMGTHAAPSSQAQELLLTAMGIGLGRADLIGHLESDLILNLTELHTSHWLATHAQAFALVGQWENASTLIAKLEQHTHDDNPPASRQLASTLVVAQQATAAWDVIEPLANDADAQVEDLLLGAQIAQTRQSFEAAAAYLERATQIDPFNEKIAEQLFMLRSPSSPTGDKEELGLIVRQLSSTRPRSTLFGLLRARELARNNLITEAEILLIDLNTRYPHREIGYDLLLSIWKTQSTTNYPDALVEGVEWLEDRIRTNPNSIQGIIKTAQGLLELEEPQRSYQTLVDGYARTGSFELGRTIELMLDGPMELPQEAREHAIDRLSKLEGIDPAIEYAVFLATLQTQEAIDDLLTRLHTSFQAQRVQIELLPAQKNLLTQLVFALVDSVETLHSESSILELISLIETHSPQLGFHLARVQVLLLSQQPELDLDQLIGVMRASAAQANEELERDQLLTLPIQSLLGEGRTHEAIALLSRLSIESDSLNADFVVETYRLLGAVGNNADMLGVLDLYTQNDGMLAQAIELTTNQLGTPARSKPAVTLDEQRADLAYTAAVMASAFERDDQSESYYQLALSYDINHAWSNNDYGYMLAEIGDRMEYAVELLERAVLSLPNEASVIDSLAWVRYKMGIFDDIEQGEDQPKTQGAISLLERANKLDVDRENATIMLHLGDALWRGGYIERASNAWIGAEDIARSRIRQLNGQPNPNQRAIDAMSSELREIRYRLQDAESTGHPTLAPLGDGYSTDSVHETAADP
ncbi:hypothetical protein COB72_06435 [bacterium]|nr:MAG: hypothetical protein COB72_06435 [bacterium]